MLSLTLLLRCCSHPLLCSSWTSQDKNWLSGTISINKTSSLASFTADSNLLSGTITMIEQIDDNEVNMTRLCVHSNRLSGTISAGTASMTRLNRLYMSANQISGSIPSQLGRIHNVLEHLYLQSNALSGDSYCR